MAALCKLIAWPIGGDPQVIVGSLMKLRREETNLCSSIWPGKYQPTVATEDESDIHWNSSHVRCKIFYYNTYQTQGREI